MIVLIVAVGLRVTFAARMAVLTYREIMEGQGRPVPMEPVTEQPVMCGPDGRAEPDAWSAGCRIKPCPGDPWH